MSSTLPPLREPAAPPAGRVQQRTVPSRRPAARRRRRRRVSRMAPWQWAVMALLGAGLVAALVFWGLGNSRLTVLRAQREQERLAYEKQVRDHQVRYRELIERYAAEYGLNPAFVSAIIMNESSYNPKAVSSKGAMGLMQFMPDTFEWVRNNCNYRNADIDVLYDPEASIKMGCYLLKYICQKLNTDDPILIACAYHAGWGTVPTWLSNYSTDGVTLTIDQIPPDRKRSDGSPDYATRNYVKKVINSYAIYLQHYY